MAASNDIGANLISSITSASSSSDADISSESDGQEIVYVKRRRKIPNTQKQQQELPCSTYYVGPIVAVLAVVMAIIAITATETESPLRNSTCVRNVQALEKTTASIIFLVVLVAAISVIAAAQRFIIVIRNLCQEDSGKRIVPSLAALTLLLIVVLVAAQRICNRKQYQINWLSLLSVALAATAIFIYVVTK